MKTEIEALFRDNPNLEAQIAAFLNQDPEYIKAEREFYETAEKIAALAGFELYDRLEQRLGAYMARTGDLHYLFGLGLRQELIRTMGLDG